MDFARVMRIFFTSFVHRQDVYFSVIYDIKENYIYRWHGTDITSLQSRFYLSLVMLTRLILIRDYK